MVTEAGALLCHFSQCAPADGVFASVHVLEYLSRDRMLKYNI
jgi:hypothetical protein